MPSVASTEKRVLAGGLAASAAVPASFAAVEAVGVDAVGVEFAGCVAAVAATALIVKPGVPAS